VYRAMERSIRLLVRCADPDRLSPQLARDD
jgi:hypothetical protein